MTDNCQASFEMVVQKYRIKVIIRDKVVLDVID